MTDEVAEAISLGDHGSTFAGGPLVCTSGLHVMSRLQESGFLDEVVAKGERRVTCHQFEITVLIKMPAWTAVLMVLT